MKKIHSIRHAKSSWKNDALADVNRPLNRRGIKTDFCNKLSNSTIDNIPTCAYVQLTAKADFHCPQISNNSFELTDFLRPKTFRLE